jgi:hypothetical protein
MSTLGVRLYEDLHRFFNLYVFVGGTVMTTEQQEAASRGATAVEPIIPSEPEHKYRFQKGDKIASRYQVIVPLGFGGFSEVYHCQDLELPRTVAVKVLTEKGMGLGEC